jgi:hypothetical protein
MSHPLVPVGIIAVIFFLRWIARALKSGGSVGGIFSNPCDSILQGGVQARGILLKVGSQRRPMGSAGSYYEMRAVTIDVEIPGKEAYETDCMLYVPSNLCRLILPGATLELRVQSSNSIAVYGPGVGLPAT